MYNHAHMFARISVLHIFVHTIQYVAHGHRSAHVVFLACNMPMYGHT